MLLSRLTNGWAGICFEGDGGAGGVGGAGGGQQGGSGDATQGGGTGGGTGGTQGSQGTGGTQGGGGEAKFTQADVDRIVGERATRASESAVSKLLKELGFEKPDELKAAVKAHKDAEDAKKSELEKLQGAVTKAGEKQAQAEVKAAELEELLQGERMRNAIVAKASELGFEVPGDAYALIDLAEVKVGEDGKVSGFEKALEELAKSGRLKMRAGTPGAGLGTPGRKPAGKQQQQQQQGGEQGAAPIIRF